jgi:hypothetical protein
MLRRFGQHNISEENLATYQLENFSSIKVGKIAAAEELGKFRQHNSVKRYIHRKFLSGYACWRENFRV